MSASHEHDAVDVSNATDMETEEKKQKKEHGHGHSHDHDEGKHAEICSIGTVTIAGSTFMIDREGQVECGKETEFGVELVGGKEATPSAAWLANPNGDKVADPVEGEGHDKHWHFKVDPLMPVKKSKFVLKVGDEEGIVDFCHGARPTNGGILAVFKGLGFLELKLHGDAGDLELWLYTTAGKPSWGQASAGKPVPFDIPPTEITLTFPSHPGKSVTMAVRDTEENKDEDDKPNMRDGKTNYFIFPGESDQDPAWLIGETVTSWRGIVEVSLEVGGKTLKSEPFVLVPHDAL
jgi:hypothetical protein